MRYQDINYINHVDQYNTESERYSNRWKNIQEYQQFLKESNPLYFENEFISFLHEHNFKQLIPFIERLEINNDKLIVKHNCNSEQYINLCLVTNYFIKYPTLYRRTQGTFKCTCCGHKINADVNASRNIIKRRSFDIKMRSLTNGRKVRITRCLILETLLQNHYKKCNKHSSEVSIIGCHPQSA